LVAANSAICSRSPVESDRVERLRTVFRNVASLACTAGSACGPADRPRVTGFGFNASRILSEEMLLSPASARPAVIDSAAVSVIAFSAKNLSKRVIVVSSLLRLMTI
jgi:hypothetical protein